MAFRRPRLNVKPNVQATRPVSTSARSQENTVESTSTQSQEDHVTQQNEIITIPTIVIEPPGIIEEEIEPLPPPPPPPISPSPVPEVLPSISAPPSPPPLPSSTPIARTLFRRKILPTITGKTSIQHRRPSASCSGTESESESTRQKHALASTITFGRPSQPPPKPPIFNETPINPIPDSPIEEDPTTSTKIETMPVETSAVDSSLINHNPNPLVTRANARVSAEYLTQHINYRAQRLAAKVEPGMTIRKRRAATLEKLGDGGGNQNGAVDTSKLKIADFVHYNPVANPMEAKAKARVDNLNDPVRKQSISSTDGANSSLAPQLKIDANGSLVVDEESLYIRNVDDTPRNTVIVEGQFNDDNLTHRSHRKIGRRKRWNGRDTLRFYQALRMCGTDFTLIARFFPNRDRDDIKRKFKTEDKANRTSVDSALRQRIPFDLTCFFSPSEESSNDENGSDVERIRSKKPRKRRVIKRKSKTTSSDPLEINRRREKRLQAKKNSTRMKKSAEFINDDEDEDDDDDEESSMDVADTVEVTTTALESKLEQVIPSTHNEENSVENSLPNLTEFENLFGRIDGSHLLFVHNTDESTGLERIDVHVVMTNPTGDNNEQSI